MTPPTTWAAGAVLTGLVAAGMPSTAAAGTPQPPTADAIAQSADAISKCLTDHGYPPLPSGAVLSPAPAGPAGSAPAITLPAAGTITLPVPGTATPAAGVTTPATGVTTPATGVTTPAAGVTTPAAGVATPATGIATPSAASTTPTPGGTLQCGQFVINNYFVTVTTTTTTTNVDAPITAAAGSISTTTGTASPAPPRPSVISAVGRPLRARGSARPGHKRSARGGRVIRVRLPGKARHPKRVVRIRLIRVGYTSRR
jgi:hypothetical protein